MLIHTDPTEKTIELELDGSTSTLTLEEAEARVKDLADRLRDHEQDARSCRLELGRLLAALKAQCEHGEWMTVYNRLGIHKNTVNHVLTLWAQTKVADGDQVDPERCLHVQIVECFLSDTITEDRILAWAPDGKFPPRGKFAQSDAEGKMAPRCHFGDDVLQDAVQFASGISKRRWADVNTFCGYYDLSIGDMAERLVGVWKRANRAGYTRYRDWKRVDQIDAAHKVYKHFCDDTCGVDTPTLVGDDLVFGGTTLNDGREAQLIAQALGYDTTDELRTHAADDESVAQLVADVHQHVVFAPDSYHTHSLRISAFGCASFGSDLDDAVHNLCLAYHDAVKPEPLEIDMTDHEPLSIEPADDGESAGGAHDTHTDEARGLMTDGAGGRSAGPPAPGARETEHAKGDARVAPPGGGEQMLLAGEYELARQAFDTISSFAQQLKQGVYDASSLRACRDRLDEIEAMHAGHREGA